MVDISCLIKSSYLDCPTKIARERDAKLRILQSLPNHPCLFQPNRVQERVSLALNYTIPILLRLTMADDVHPHDRSL